MFNQCEQYRNEFKEMERIYLDEMRYYKVEGDLSYPSITSVISFINRNKFAEWRARVGNEEANKISKQATTRGTKFHRVAEVYLQNGDYKSLPEWNTPLVQLMFSAAKKHLDDRINNIYQQETHMFTKKLCLAGTVDLICEVDGELSIVDFKTSKEEKPLEWLEDYFVQLSAYWAMFAEKTGVTPKKLVVFLVAENGDVQIVEKTNVIDYLTKLQDYVSRFIQHRNA